MILQAALVLFFAALLGLSWLLRPRQRLDGGVRALLVAFALLGAWALWFGALAAPGLEPAVVRYLKPTVLYWTLGAILLVAPLAGGGYPVKALIGSYIVFTDREWRWINLGIALALLILGGVNIAVVLTGTESDWEGFKWGCMVNLVAVFLLRLTFRWLDAIVRIATHLRARARAPSP